MKLTRRRLSVATEIVHLLDPFQIDEANKILEIVIDVLGEKPDSAPVLKIHENHTPQAAAPPTNLTLPSIEELMEAATKEPVRPKGKRASWSKHPSKAVEAMVPYPRLWELTPAQSKNLARNVKRWRETNKINSVAMARKIQKLGYRISPPTIRNIEEKEFTTVSKMTVWGIAALMKISPEELVKRHA